MQGNIIKNMHHIKEILVCSFSSSSENAQRMGNFCHILDAALEAASSCTSSDEEEELEKVTHIGCLNFVDTIDAYDDEDFRSHMRLNKTTVENLIERYEQSVSTYVHPKHGKEKVSAKKMIYMYIWYISNTVTYRQLANLFGVAKSTAWEVVGRVVSWILSLSDEFIKWPTGGELENTARKFASKKITGAIGAIYGTHISINAPKNNKECYFNRKQNYSLQMQAVVDADKKFINIHCGEPGSLHDSRVFRRSDLFQEAVADRERLFPNGAFLLGDSAYAGSSWLVTPFRDNGCLTSDQKKFNKLHSSARIVVEHAFGLWKGRFRRMLKFTEHRNLKSVTDIIISSCILHNICILEGDSFHFEELPPNDATENVFEDSPHIEHDDMRRNMLFNTIMNSN